MDSGADVFTRGYLLANKRMGNTVKILKLHTVAILSVILISTVATAGEFAAPDFRAKVTNVSNSGVVYFEGHGGYRLWGLLPEADYLRELLVGEELACYVAGELRGYWGGVSATSRSAVCISLDPNPNPFRSKGVIQYLLDSGHVTEFCAETLGLFGTCAERSFGRTE